MQKSGFVENAGLRMGDRHILPLYENVLHNRIGVTTAFRHIASTPFHFWNYTSLSAGLSHW